MTILKASQITDLQKKLVIIWHKSVDESKYESEIVNTEEEKSFSFLTVENHYYNFLLWHEEDKARRKDMGFEYIYHAKRKIDFYNQQRNDFIEKIDRFIINIEKPPQKGCPFNSETPAMMIDRLSILSLKYYHMIEQTERADIKKDLKKKCIFKAEIIEKQLADLENCLNNLLQEIKAKTRSFRVYYQFKMYNDEKLNPQLYNQNK